MAFCCIPQLKKDAVDWNGPLTLHCNDSQLRQMASDTHHTKLHTSRVESCWVMNCRDQTSKSLCWTCWTCWTKATCQPKIAHLCPSFWCQMTVPNIISWIKAHRYVTHHLTYAILGAHNLTEHLPSSHLLHKLYQPIQHQTINHTAHWCRALFRTSRAVVVTISHSYMGFSSRRGTLEWS